MENEYGKYSFVALRCTVNHSLTHSRLLFWVRTVLADQYVDDLSVAGGGSKMDCLCAIVTVPLSA